MLGMEGTCWASTCKSGSEIVMTKPMTKLTKITIHTFLDLVIIVPVRSPIGVMDNSTPTLKNSIPIISNVAPTKKVINILGGIGAIVKQSSSTIAKIGSTAFIVSENFSINFPLRLECCNCKRSNTFLYLMSNDSKLVYHVWTGFVCKKKKIKHFSSLNG